MALDLPRLFCFVYLYITVTEIQKRKMKIKKATLHVVPNDMVGVSPMEEPNSIYVSVNGRSCDDTWSVEFASEHILEVPREEFKCEQGQSMNIESAREYWEKLVRKYGEEIIK